MTNKSGVFEVPEQLYDQLIIMYETFVTPISNDTFEEFCGKMVTEGITQYSMKLISHMEKL